MLDLLEKRVRFVAKGVAIIGVCLLICGVIVASDIISLRKSVHRLEKQFQSMQPQSR
jgi:hypothetical protein